MSQRMTEQGGHHAGLQQLCFDEAEGDDYVRLLLRRTGGEQ